MSPLRSNFDVYNQDVEVLPRFGVKKLKGPPSRSRRWRRSMYFTFMVQTICVIAAAVIGGGLLRQLSIFRQQERARRDEIKKRQDGRPPDN